MPRHVSEMSPEVLLGYAAAGDESAVHERMRREVMAVDQVEWDVANLAVRVMQSDNERGMALKTLSYKIGIAAGFSAGLASIPLCFDLESVRLFNEAFVTMDLPEDRDLETWLEVGAFAWNYMEPPLGQLSFLLLCLQFARAQMQNLGVTPYTGWVTSSRAKALADKYPQYNRNIVMNFSATHRLTRAGGDGRSGA